MPCWWMVLEGNADLFLLCLMWQSSGGRNYQEFRVEKLKANSDDFQAVTEPSSSAHQDVSVVKDVAIVLGESVFEERSNTLCMAVCVGQCWSVSESRPGQLVRATATNHVLFCFMLKTSLPLTVRGRPLKYLQRLHVHNQLQYYVHTHKYTQKHTFSTRGFCRG